MILFHPVEREAELLRIAAEGFANDADYGVIFFSEPQLREPAAVLPDTRGRAAGGVVSEGPHFYATVDLPPRIAEPYLRPARPDQIGRRYLIPAGVANQFYNGRPAQ